jgi:glycerol-3-phosphate O-acyltransferase
MFSENWAFVGPFRRLLSIVFNGRSTLIRFGEPRSIRGYAAAGPDGARGARRLLKDMRAEFRHMRVDTLGPDLSRRRAIVAQVLRTRAVRQAVRQEIRDTKRTRRDGLLVARRQALEIAANYSHTFVRIAERILSRFLTRVYDGIEVSNAEYLDRLPPACEIVYMPCHRSHVDYLLLSYVIYRRGYAVPYVAAGVNLNLPVIGRLLRKGGAFYIRRSFRGSGLYPIVFMKYVDVMMNRGHPIEFFIEGGRSRTGRLLRPRTGMLAMTVRSYLRDTRRPVAYVPVYFGYDKLLEGEAYIDELMGRPKDKESVGGLLSVLPQLRSQLGRVHVSFGEPLLLDSMLDKVHPEWRQDPLDEDARPAWFGDAVDEVAGEIMRRINSAAAVTPVNLLSVALLAAPRQAMLEHDLERQLQLYIDLLKCFPYSPNVSVAASDGASIIKHGEQMGLLDRRKHPLGDVLRMEERNAVLATYYRNNVLHLFAMPSLVACAFLNNSAMRHEDIQRLPPGARQPLADVAMPALRRLPPEPRAKLLRVAHLLIAADGRLTVREFLLFSILKRRLGPDAGRPVPVRYAAVRELAKEASQVLSLVALVRLPERPDHAFNAGALQLKDVDARRVEAEALQLDSVSAALDRLNQLAPLAKPILIKAATAVAFVDDRTNWKAASSLRMICAALDAPLPPQVLAAEAA